MERFVIIVNKERLYLCWKGTYFTYYFSSDIFDDGILRFNSLNEAIEFIKIHADFIPMSKMVNDYKEKYGKIELYPSKVVLMYNIHKAIKVC